MNRPRILALLIPTLTAVGLYLTLDWADDRATATSERAAMTDTLQAGQTLESRARAPIQAYSQELQTTIFDAQMARCSTRFSADSQTQFEDQTSLLTQPRITLFDAGKPNWNITADYGRIERHSERGRRPLDARDSAEEELVRFIGNASLNAALANTSTLALQSSEFSLIPSVEKIRSDKPVRVIDQGINQTAVGFEANLTEDSLYFEKEIRGTYEPPR